MMPHEEYQAMHDLTGQFIKGYELRAQIGVGGYGVVYRAVQPSVGREVAVKIILPQYANHPDFIRRFEAEAQLVARLEHPHIVPLYDYWRQPDSAFLVMRYVRGGSLHDRLTGEPWSPQAVAGLLDQLGAALTIAHRHGVVHRDLKPANILLDEDGNAYLADFGIAKDLSADDIGTPVTTQTGAVVGSPAYISPEQIKAEAITPQTDIYSLGIMLYEILTGVLPFEGPTPVVVMFKHVHEQLPRLQMHRSDLPDALNSVIQRATAKHPDQRYADVMALVADYRHAIGAAPLERSFGGAAPAQKNGGNGHRTTGGRRTGSIYDTGVLYHTALMDAVVPTIENPYKGLRAFQEADAADFFGREALVERLLARLAEPGVRGQEMGDSSGTKTENPTSNPQLPTPNSRFLAVIGPSGSGKSSVVRAGVIPAVRRGALPGSRHWFVVEMIPGAHPMAELANALLRVAVGQPHDLLGRLQKDERGLLNAIQRLLPGGAETELLLVIDQFEEVFTLVESEAERTHFLNSLLAAVTDSRSRLRVIMTLRADFYDRPLLYTGLSELVRQRTEVVTPLAADELQHAIVGPARRVGVGLEPELVAAILRDVGEQPGTLPLMEYALTELFDRRSGRSMSLASYQKSGGVMGALTRRADTIYESFDPQQQEAARQLFLRLVTLGEGMEDTRRRVLVSEFGIRSSDAESSDRLSQSQRPITPNPEARIPNSVQQVIDTYGKYWLLTFDRDPVTRGPTVEVAHEALIRTWSRLRDWLDASRDDLRTQRRLAVAAAEWVAARRDRSYLASGVRLEQFDEWSNYTQLALNADERTYLDASLAERDTLRAQEQARVAREAALERRSRNVLRALVGVFVVATLLAMGLATLAFTQRQAAQRNAQQAQEAQRVALVNEERAMSEADRAARSAAEARNLALSAGAQAAVRQGNTDLALALALAGNQLDPAIPQEQLTLAEAAYTPGARRVYRGHTNRVEAVAFTPDGTKALSGANDQTLILWDIATGQVIRRFEGHTEMVGTVAMHPDGRHALSGSNDTTMILWDLETGQAIRTFQATDEVQGVALSPDGRQALSSSQDGLLTLWDVETGREIHRLTGHTQEVKNAAFSKDGRTAISCSADQTMILWDLATGQVLSKFEGLDREINDLALSPDGRTVFTGSADGLGLLWDMQTKQEIRRFPGHISEVRSVRFSPDGKWVATGSLDSTVMVWDVATGERVRYLAGHGSAIRSIAFSPDGHTLLSASEDQTLRLWNLDYGAETRGFSGHAEGVTRVAISPDGKTALSGSNDYTLILWDLATGAQLRQFAGHDGTVQGVAFTPDGKTAISASNDGLLILWDVATGQFIRKFEGHQEQVNAVALSQDGTKALSGSSDQTLILWDVATAQPIQTLKGHETTIRSVALSADGKLALSGGNDGTIVMWDLATGQPIWNIEGHAAGIRDVSFSPDGKTILSGSDDKSLFEWEASSGKSLRRFPQEHNGAVRAARYSPDGQFILSSSADATIIVWDAAAGQAIRRFTGHKGVVTDAAWSPDGHNIISASQDRSLILWRFDSSAELVDWATANRHIPQLSCDQVQRYGLDTPCEDPAEASAP
jgi:WD40 repeat protein